MKKYVRFIVDNLCKEVFIGTNYDFAKKQGFHEVDVEEVDGIFYVKGHAPEPSVLSQIAELEIQITPRRVREAILTNDFSFIEEKEKQIQQLREKIKK